MRLVVQSAAPQRAAARGLLLPLALLTLGSVCVVAMVLVAQASSRYGEVASGGTAEGGVSAQQLRSRVLRDPMLQRQLWRLAQQADTVQAFEAALEESGLIPSQQAPAAEAAGQQAVRKRQAPGDSSVPRLSKELAHAHARDGIVIVTWSNYHFHDFVLNWVHHVRAHGIENFLVGAMDLESAQVFLEHDIPTFAMFGEEQTSSGLTTENLGWGSPAFHKMGRQKVELAKTFSSYGLDVCLCDADTLWIKDPTPYFQQFPQADILASSDQLVPSIEPGDTGLELPGAVHSALNIGLIFFRHSPATERFITAWSDMLRVDDSVWDQNAFNQLAKEGLEPMRRHSDNRRLVYGFKGSVVIGVLPIASFCSGHTFFVQKLFQVQKVPPYAVHTTFQYGGTAGKRHRLREAMLWVDEAAYYSEGRFLSVELAKPPIPNDFDTWENEDMRQYHLEGMQGQLQQLRQALGLAVALNRTIIMPKLLCFCDRYWGPVERCRVPGARLTRLPFVCPLDHVLEPFHFDSKPGPHGPAIRFREYSFLDNERTPEAVRAGKVYVTPKEGVQQAQVVESKEFKTVQVPLGSNDKQLRTALEAVQDAPLLHFTTLEGALGGWAEKQHREGFVRRLHQLAGFWCCKKVEKGSGEEPAVQYISLMLPHR